MQDDRDDTDGQDIALVLENLAAAVNEVEAAKQEITKLKRELGVWQRRTKRAELECLKWKATAEEWRREWAKRS